MAAAAMPTDGDADTLPLQRTDLPTQAEIAAAFPDLEILGLIGHGGMSAVFKARQPKLDRVVALKVLPKSLAATPGFAERFHREGRVLARLSHPSIVTVHDFGESGGFAYLVMEFVDGVNLRQAMRAGRFTPEQALKIIPAICDALQFAHTQGVLHRDIKPENILLDTTGRVKIADFGIAKILDEKGGDMLLTQSGAKLGTAPYMAPEQIEQPSSVDHRADIYSLGVVFYEMLTGELPLGRFAAPSEKSAVGGNIDEIVFRALEKERGRRQQSAGEFKTQIEGTGVMMPRRRKPKLGEPFEYKSKRTLCGLPLLHVVSGRDPETGKRREAHGVIAVGDRARGVFAFGGIARGWFAFGGLAMGLVAFGGVGIGLISISGLAIGLLLACGGLSLGALAMGGMAAGYHAVGGMALGWHGMGGTVFAHQGHGGLVKAAEVVQDLKLMPPLTQALASTLAWNGLLAIIWLPVSVFIWCAYAWARQHVAVAAGEAPRESASARVFWLVPAITLATVALCWLVCMQRLACTWASVVGGTGWCAQRLVLPQRTTGCGFAGGWRRGGSGAAGGLVFVGGGGFGAGFFRRAGNHRGHKLAGHAGGGFQGLLGHAGGDAVLRSFAATAEGVMRQGDVFGRVGGEEFAALLPQTTLDGAMVVAERLRQRIHDQPAQAGGVVLPFTVSIGVAAWPGASSGSDPDIDRLMVAADRALYAAKAQGRDRVVADKDTG